MMIRLYTGVVYESIASTYVDGAVYHTPLGFRASGHLLRARLYPETRLYRVVDRAKFVVLNLTRNPFYYLASAFKGRVEARLEFVDARCVKAPRLVGAEAYIEALVTGVRPSNGVKVVDLEPLCVDVGEALTPYSRADAALIEMIVYATKVPVLREKGDVEGSSYYTTLFNVVRGIIGRVSDNKLYKDVVEFLGRVVSG